MLFRWVVLSFSIGGDLPDKVSARVCDEGVAVVVDDDIIGSIDLFGGEGGEEEAAAGAEVVGDEGVERRDPRRKCCGGDGMCGILV